jgi:hypothetical protein
VAQNFSWPHGTKRIIVRSENMGLLQQWLQAWHPRSVRDVAFIFEDDTEVSPAFFLWSIKAVEKYYSKSKYMRMSHGRLIKLILSTCHNPDGNISKSSYRRIFRFLNESKETSELSLTALEKYVADYSGAPTLYGICLQRQHLDASHYPRKLSIRNGYRPYLYRCCRY